MTAQSRVSNADVASRHATFNASYGTFCRVARRRARAYVAVTGLSVHTRHDIEQEILCDAWRKLPHFNPSKSSLRTFAELLAAHVVASLRRTLYTRGSEYAREK